MNLDHVARHNIDPDAYQKADPFPHMVIDNFLDPRDADVLSQEFPKPNEKWLKYDTPFERKFALDRTELMPDIHKNSLLHLNSSLVVSFLSQLTGYKDLTSDPYLRGGGLHSIPHGGFLDMHTDRQNHPRLHLWRRVNLLIYLNQNWKPEFKGELELWNQDMTKCVKKIEPIFNRAIIFNTDSKSFHGHPDPWANEVFNRESLALYYWTGSWPKGLLNYMSTDFRKRPQDTDSPEKILARKKRLAGHFDKGPIYE